MTAQMSPHAVQRMQLDMDSVILNESFLAQNYKFIFKQYFDCFTEIFVPRKLKCQTILY